MRKKDLWNEMRFQARRADMEWGLGHDLALALRAIVPGHPAVTAWDAAHPEHSDDPGSDPIEATLVSFDPAGREGADTWEQVWPPPTPSDEG